MSLFPPWRWNLDKQVQTFLQLIFFVLFFVGEFELWGENGRCGLDLVGLWFLAFRDCVA